MKKTLYTLLALVLSFAAVSCNDFLEETPKGQLLSNLAFTQKGDLESAFRVLRYKVSRSTFGTTQFEQAYMGDDLATHPKSNKAAMREWDNMEVSSGNERLLWHWQDKWEVIKAANFIINGAANAPESEADITRAINTAKFWRAWAYFDLVRVFGAVPLITSLDIDYGMGLSSVATVYDQIVADLTDACNLPKNTPDGLIEGVSVNQDPNSGAAHALLACVYLNMAGWPLQKGDAYYALCKQECEAVINGGYYYDLYEDYRDIHSAKCNHNNKEAILAIYYTNTHDDGDSSLSARGGIMDFPDCSNGWCDTRGELKFYAEFPDGYRKSVVYPKTVVRRNGIYDFWDPNVPTDNQFPYFGEKGWPSGANDNDNNPPEYDFTNIDQAFDQSGGWDTQAHMIIRLSEVYCWYAECCARAGDTGTAITYLNKVRNRADKAETNFYTGKTQDQLIEGAYNEHRWEIGGWWAGAIESCFNDMARLKKAQAHYEYRKAAPAVTVAPGISLSEPYGPTGTWADYRMFVDYPSQEKLRNPNLDVDLSEKITDPFIFGTEVIKK